MATSILWVVFSPVPSLRAASDFVAANPADGSGTRATP
jgi:hypothetical protein